MKRWALLIAAGVLSAAGAAFSQPMGERPAGDQLAGDHSAAGDAAEKARRAQLETLRATVLG
ncbi:MAG TPA: hypothetical protein PKZ97_17990, partial [Azospirillaceae bacterium]|nr:hypothetical protein [Azospirillaceae bacterium]